MDEIEELSVDTVSGDRPATTAGDRMMVGLAALALLSGLLIAGANLLGGFADDGVADASPSATAVPSRTPRPTPTSPPLRDLTVVPGTPPKPFDYGSTSVHGWLEVTNELAVVGAPTVGAREVTRLPAGSVALVFQDWSANGDDGWLQTASPVGDGYFGWIQLRDASGQDNGVFYPIDAGLHSGAVGTLASGPDGYLALLWPPARGGGQATPTLAASLNGERWESLEVSPMLTQTGSFMGAWGPSGWLAAAQADGPAGAQIWIWESYDGRDWSPLGRLPLAAVPWGSQMVASEHGYLLALSDGAGRASTWYSPDGVTWQESVAPFGAAGSAPRYPRFLGSEPISVLAVGSGFVAWTGSYDGAPGGAQVAFSPNGRTWSTVEIDQAAPGRLQLASAGQTVLATATMSNGSTRAWRGTIVGDRLTRLDRAPRLEIGFEASVIDSLFSDGVQVWALGFDRIVGSPRLWSTDGRSWRSHALPVALESGVQQPLQGVAGPAGPVVVGARPTSAGDNPVFWHLRPDGSWAPEPSPIIPLVPDPSAADCGALPTTAVGFAVLEPRLAPACHGHTPMTFVAWSGPCDWCDSSPAGALTGARWLTGGTRTLLLSPIPAADGWWREAVVHPDLEMQRSWTDAWLRVTGHYADPAAGDCEWDVGSGEAAYYDAAGRLAVSYCRERFVVTEVTVVNGPASASD